MSNILNFNEYLICPKCGEIYTHVCKMETDISRDNHRDLDVVLLVSCENCSKDWETPFFKLKIIQHEGITYVSTEII